MLYSLFEDIGTYTERIIKCASVFVFLVGWHLGSLYYHELILPSPIDTAYRLYDIFVYERGYTELGITIIRAMTGFLTCVIMAMLLGILSGLIPIIRAFLHPLERLMVSIPPIAWVVLTVLWLGGTGIGSAVVTIAVSSFPLVYMSIMQGVKTIDKQLLEMGRSFGMSPLKAVLKIGGIHVLSVAFPAITIAFGQSWKVGVMAEVLGASNGIGAQISRAQVNLDTIDVFSWVFVTVILFVITDKIFVEPINKYTMKWR